MTDAGLIKKSQKNDGYYDVFRNRLMFPVIDVRGNVVGFSGRALGDAEPKYLNSSDTAIFSKSQNLFALNIAKKTKSGMLILTEGNIDVVSLHQAGFDCAVASLGTALTDAQVRLMARYTGNLIIAFDSDGAGGRAAQRAIKLTEKTGMSVRLLRIQDAKDPDEYINKFGADAFKRLIERSENHIVYRLEEIKKKFDVKTDDGRIGYLSEAVQLLAGVASRPEREIYAARLAEETGVSSASIENEIAGLTRRNEWRQKRRRGKELLRPAAAAQPTARALRYHNARSAVAEEGVLRCILLDSALMDDARNEGLDASEFTSPFLAKVYGVLQAGIEKDRSVTPAGLMPALGADEAERVSAILQKPEMLSDGRAALRDYIQKIRLEKSIATAKSAESFNDEDILSVYRKYKETKGLGGQ
jgi:DNA primase